MVLLKVIIFYHFNNYFNLLISSQTTITFLFIIKISLYLSNFMKDQTASLFQIIYYFEINYYALYSLLLYDFASKNNL